MTIDEAIKLLHSLQGETTEQLATPVQQAIKLGIEALRRIADDRKEELAWVTRTLPGETEEEK